MSLDSPHGKLLICIENDLFKKNKIKVTRASGQEQYAQKARKRRKGKKGTYALKNPLLTDATPRIFQSDF